MEGLTETTKNSEWTFSELRFELVFTQLRIRRAKNLNCHCVYTAHTFTVLKLPHRFWSEEKSECCQACVEANFTHCALHRLIFFCFFQYLSHEKSACVYRGARCSEDLTRAVLCYCHSVPCLCLYVQVSRRRARLEW